MEYLWDFSTKGERKFYSLMNKKKEEVENLIKDPEQKTHLLSLVEENIKIYERERISQANIVIELIKKHGYSPKEGYEFIKKEKTRKLNLLENSLNKQNKDNLNQNDN